SDVCSSDLGGGRGEMALLERPGAWVAVLVAHDPDELAAPIDRRIEDGADPERLEVEGGELAGHRIGQRVARHDEAVLAQGLHVAWKRDRRELLDVRTAGAAVELVDALDRLAVVLEEPHPDPLDPEALGADARRRAEPALERVVAVRDLQLRQREARRFDLAPPQLHALDSNFARRDPRSE